MGAIDIATNGTSTTSWCPLPTGFTKVPAVGCNILTPNPSQPTSSPGPRPTFEPQCNTDHTDRVSFTREDAIDAFNRGCGTGSSSTKLTDPKHFAIFEGQKNITGIWGWSSDQSRCSARTDDTWSLDDCKGWFGAAMDNCDTNTQTEKWGSKMVYSSPKGCLDVELYGLVRH